MLEYQLLFKKNRVGTEKAEKAAKELKSYSEEIAALDEKMMKLRNRIDEI